MARWTLRCNAFRHRQTEHAESQRRLIRGAARRIVRDLRARHVRQARVRAVVEQAARSRSESCGENSSKPISNERPALGNCVSCEHAEPRALHRSIATPAPATTDARGRGFAAERQCDARGVVAVLVGEGERDRCPRARSSCAPAARRSSALLNVRRARPQRAIGARSVRTSTTRIGGSSYACVSAATTRRRRDTPAPSARRRGFAGSHRPRSA